MTQDKWKQIGTPAAKVTEKIRRQMIFGEALREQRLFGEKIEGCREIAKENLAALEDRQ